MVIISSRHVTRHDRHPGGRSSFRPQPINDTITTSSVRRSVIFGKRRGCGAKSPAGAIKPKIRKPIPTQTMGSDSGNSRNSMGNQATSRISRPLPVSTAI
jgi:hypothetical protein